MAEVVLNNVRKNYDPAVHKDTLRSINLDIKEGSSSSSSARPAAESPPCFG